MDKPANNNVCRLCVTAIEPVKLPSGGTTTALVGEEKGINIRIALDVVRLTLENRCDVALLFSQDQDLAELSAEIRLISSMQSRLDQDCQCVP